MSLEREAETQTNKSIARGRLPNRSLSRRREFHSNVLLLQNYSRTLTQRRGHGLSRAVEVVYVKMREPPGESRMRIIRRRR